MPPTYRKRLRIEGLTMAASGAVASAVLIAFVPASRRWPLNTLAQLGVVLVLLEALGVRSVRGYMRKAIETVPGQEGSGEPTPLWQLPLIMGGLAAAFVLLPETGIAGSGAAGWDAGLRVTGGCMLVGLAQGVRFERVVAADERARRRRYFRGPGSRLGKGTVLLYTPDPSAE